ncbi:unnamed protein product, partial [Adineta ricciae]
TAKAKLNRKNAKKKTVKRCQKRNSNEILNKNAIPIFTDAFLDLFRKQKSEIRSLKFNYSELTEKFKLKDAQQEQIRLDNQKMRLDIEEISQKNYFIKNQIEKFEKEFQNVFHQTINQDFLKILKDNQHEHDYQVNIQNIFKTLQL